MFNENQTSFSQRNGVWMQTSLHVFEKQVAQDRTSDLKNKNFHVLLVAYLWNLLQSFVYLFTSR